MSLSPILIPVNIYIIANIRTISNEVISAYVGLSPYPQVNQNIFDLNLENPSKVLL